MKVLKSVVEKLRITDTGMETIDVLIENIIEGAGQLTISSGGVSHTAYWGNMGSNLENFIQRTNNHYLLGKMTNYSEDVPDLDGDVDFLKGLILKSRRCGQISGAEAAEAFYVAENLIVNRYTLFYSSVPDALNCLEGMDEPWHLDWPNKNNHKYSHWCKILDVVREAIRPGGVL